MKKFLVAFSLIIFSIGINSCGGGGGGTDGFGSAAISSPFAIGTSTSSLSFHDTTTIEDSYEKRKAFLEDLFTAKDVASCKFPLNVLSKITGEQADCYGVNLYQSGTHPNDTGYNFNTSNRYLPTGDLGIWNATNGSSGESCTAAEINSLLKSHGSTAFFAQMAAASADCYARNSSVGLPSSKGDKVSFDETAIAAFKFTSGSDSFTPSAVSIEAIEDSSGNAGKKYTITGTVTQGANYPFSVVVQSVKKSGGGFAGTAAYIVRVSSFNEGNCGTSGVSISGYGIFSRETSSANVRVKLDSARFCGTSYPAEPGEVRACDTKGDATDSDSANGWGGDWNHMVFDFNPSTKVGKYSYAWQAGKGDANTRVFNAELSSDSSGVGYFGYGDKVSTSADTSCQTASTLGEIKGLVCNWNAPGHNNTIKDYVQKQTITKNSSDIWVPATNKISYAPTNSCSVTDDAYTYYAVANNSSSTSLNYSNDSANVTVPRLDLEDLANYKSGFTQPTAPTF